AQSSKPLFNIKETRLLHLPASPINAREMKSHRKPQNQRVFRTLHLIVNDIRMGVTTRMIPRAEIAHQTLFSGE
ncbi:hypothetical protein, partial [Gluconobacter kondonii]|uniref:hypothetical protein n=1 Tax=Gluconobacter kondonii TaxID=941463 RepID=UPI001B8AC01E